MKNLSKKLLLLLAAMALIAAACGSDDDDSAGDTDDGAVTDGGGDAESGEAELEGTLRVMIHQNPPMVEWVENFNADFEAANPGVTIDLSVIDAADIPTANQTRLSAGDVDVTTVTVTGFANPGANLHAPDENIRVDRYIQGIKYAACIMEQFGKT